MRIFSTAAGIIAMTVLCVCADTRDGDPAAEALMASVTAQLPPQPLEVTGTLTVRQRRGVVTGRYGFSFFLHWGAAPPYARYRISQTDGSPLEELHIRREPDGDHILYRSGNPLQETAAPPLSATIQATDITWLDLTLDFLWWEHPVLTDTETVRGFECLIVTVPAPEEHASEVAGVRLWIDREQHLLLQAEGFDRDGRIVRRLWVTSVQRVDELWMIKEMEVQRTPSVRRTRLRVEEVIEPSI